MVIDTSVTRSDCRVDADDNVGALIETLTRADDLLASAVGMIARLGARGRVEATTGLPSEILIRMACRRTRWDALELTAAADAIRHMPHLAAAVAEGMVSWSQARAIVRQLKGVDAAGRAHMDAMIGLIAPRLMSAEPETIVSEVQSAVADLRPDLALHREDRSVESSFLMLQPRLDGYGGTLYGEADAESFAIIATAVDAAAERPVDPAESDAPSRARQRMDALAAICGASLAGGPARTSAKPRLIVTMDAAGPADRAGAGHILAPVAGRPLKVSPLTAEVMTCDADVVPVVFDGAQPIGVGNTTPVIPPKVRTALIARDGGCRFPGCGAPVSWCDAHHLMRRPEGDASVNNLALFCRRCHRRLHRFRWKVGLEPYGAMTFRYRGRRYTTYGRAGPPARE